MDDFIKKVLHAVPRYLADFVAVIASPKGFAQRRRADLHDSAMPGALVFGAVSLLVTILVRHPLLGPAPDLALRTAYAVWAIAVLLTMSAILRAAWSLVGGKLEYTSYAVLSTYYFGVFMVLAHTLFLVASTPRRSPSAAALSFGLVACGLVALGVWCIRCWAAYGELNRVSTPRRVSALVITLLASVPAFILLDALQGAMLGKGVCDWLPIATGRTC